MNRDVKSILDCLKNEDYSSALDQCEIFVSSSMTSFMDELTVNTATDYVGSVVLFAQICSSMKKPWLAFPKLEAARGGLRFLKDYMSDSQTLAEAYRAFADAYAYGGFFPEAISCYLESSVFFDDRELGEDSIFSALFYQARFGKRLIEDLSFASEKFGDEKLLEIQKKAEEDAEAQILTDPVESSDEFLAVRYDVEKRTDELLSKKTDQSIPYCALYWNTKKQVLKEQFHIEWHTPAEMNPNIRFY